MGKDMFIDELGPILNNMVHSGDWKIRVAIAENVQPLLYWLGPELFMKHFQELLETLCEDVVCEVRAVSLKSMLCLMDPQQPESEGDELHWKEYILSFISRLASNRRYQLRISSITIYSVSNHVIVFMTNQPSYISSHR